MWRLNKFLFHKFAADMARKVFFSFHHQRDSWRVSQVRNSNVVTSLPKTSFLDVAAWQSIERQGERAITNWIDVQLNSTTVTVVLIGRMTSTRPWVKYEIEKSLERKNAILGVYIHNLSDQYGETDLPGFNPFAGIKVNGRDLDLVAPIYDWSINKGYLNFGAWIDVAVDNFKNINWFRGE
jgi:hypothetical protein